MLVGRYVSLLGRRPRLLLGVQAVLWAVLMALGAPLLSDPGGSGLKNGGFVDPHSESSFVSDLFSQRFVDPTADLLILLSHPTWTVDDVRYQQAYFEFKARLAAQFPVHSIISYFEYPSLVTAYSIDRTMVEVISLKLSYLTCHNRLRSPLV